VAKYRAATLILLRKLLKKRGRAHELVFHRMLIPETAEIYQTVEQIKWIPAAQAAEILLTAAQVLYPRDPQAFRKLGQEEARDNLRGMFKKRSNIVTPTMVLYRVAGIWRSYHDQGRASVERGAGKQECLVVENYPELPEAMREILAGFLQEALEMAGLKNLKVRRQESNPNAWKWFIAPE